MQVFYRDKFIKDVGSEEEARKFIEEYNNFVKAAYPDLFNRLESREKNFSERTTFQLMCTTPKNICMAGS